MAVQKQMVYTSPDHSDDIYINEDGLYVRDVTLDLAIGEDILIGMLSDIHYNYCNEQDLAEADPVIMSTLENRIWLQNAHTVPIARRCLDFIKDADQIVLNGDTLDYISHGSMELMQREIWDKYPDIIAVLGGHEFARNMQGKVPDPVPRSERIAQIEAYWKHDIYYVSKLLKNKVLVIGLLDDVAQFNESQYQKLKADIERSRENGYQILLFAHEPIATHDPAHSNYTEDMALLVRDRSGFPKDFCGGVSRGGKIVGSEQCDDTTKKMYALITNSADVIKGFFAGHYHSDLHLEILAKNPDGSDAVIPEFIHTATAYDNGHLMRIFIK